MEPNWAQAFANANRIVSVEQVLGFAWEQSLQRAFLALPDLVAALNLFYFVGHFLFTGIFFVWLYRRSRDGFRSFRDGFLAATALAVVIHWLYPDCAAAPCRRRARGHAAGAVRDRHRLADLVGALEPGRRGALAARRLRARGRDRNHPLRALSPSCGSRVRSTRRSSCSRSSSPATTSCSTRSPGCSCSRSASCSSARYAASRRAAPRLRRLSVALSRNRGLRYNRRRVAGWSSQVARRAHNPEVAGSNPAPAIEKACMQAFSVSE